MYRNCLAVLGIVAIIGLVSVPVKADADIRTQEKEKPALSDLSPSPNPLQFPTSSEEVRIQGNMPKLIRVGIISSSLPLKLQIPGIYKEPC